MSVILLELDRTISVVEECEQVAALILGRDRSKVSLKYERLQ